MVMSMDASGDQSAGSPMDDSATLSGSGSRAQGSLEEEEEQSKGSGQTVVGPSLQQAAPPLPLPAASPEVPAGRQEEEAMVLSRQASLDKSELKNQGEELSSSKQQREEICIKNDPLLARMREFVEGTSTGSGGPSASGGGQQSAANQARSSSDSLNNNQHESKASIESAQGSRRSRGQGKSSHCARHHHHHHHHHHQHHQHQHHHQNHQHRSSVSVSSGSAGHLHKHGQPLVSSGALASNQRRHHHHHHHHHHQHQNQQNQSQQKPQVSAASSEADQLGRQSGSKPQSESKSSNSSVSQAGSGKANFSSADTTNENSPRECNHQKAVESKPDQQQQQGHNHHHHQLYNGHHHHHHHHRGHHHHHHHHQQLHQRLHKKRIVSEEAGPGRDAAEPASKSEQQEQLASHRPSLQDITNQCCPYHGTGTGSHEHSRALALRHHHGHHHHGHHHHHHHQPAVSEPTAGESEEKAGQEQALKHHHHHHHHHHHVRQRLKYKNRSSSNTNVADATLPAEAKEKQQPSLQAEGENKMNLDQSDGEEAERPDKKLTGSEVVTMDMSPQLAEVAKTPSNLESSDLITTIEVNQVGRPSAAGKGVREFASGEHASVKGPPSNQPAIQRQASSSRESSQKGRREGSGGLANRRQEETGNQELTIEPCSPTRSPNAATNQKELQQQAGLAPKQVIESTVLPDRRCRLCWCCCCPCSGLSNKSNAIKSELSNKPSAEAPPASAEKCPPIPNVALEEIRSWGDSFERLMKCPEGRKVFQDFLRCEYSEENILFWIACEELKSERDAKSVATKARDIYEDYISILSAKEVSLDSRVREVINSNIKKPSSNIFDEAQLQIYTLMHRDSYPRFLNSAMYKKLAQIQTTSRKSSS